MSQNPPAIRIAIVEDRQDDRESLRELLNSSPGFECVAAYSSAREALATLPRSAA